VGGGIKYPPEFFSGNAKQKRDRKFQGGKIMKRFLTTVTIFAFVALAVLAVTGKAHADETKMVGVINKIDISGPDAKTATATLKDNDSGKLVVVTINDDLTLDKLKDHRIVEGDEIRCKYEVKDGKNISTYFRKTAGC
jgi:Cu/Ag efflux protein CusF